MSNAHDSGSPGDEPPAKRPRLLGRGEEEPTICCICLCGIPREKPLAFRCKSCHPGTFCGECLATLFRRAIQSESDMPAVCVCHQRLPVEVTGDLLTKEEVSLRHSPLIFKVAAVPWCCVPESGAAAADSSSRRRKGGVNAASAGHRPP